MNRILLLLITVLIPVVLSAQKNQKAKDTSKSEDFSIEEVNDTITSTSFFDTDVPFKISLTYDITSFIRNKQEGEYIDAVLQVYPENSEPIVKNIKLKARGNFRRGQCFFPPIYLNFKTDTIRQTELAGRNKIKVVTHCSHSKNSGIPVLKEYLAYKMYNQLTRRSFRVRLLDISYIDTGKKQYRFNEPGFIIEPEDLVADRNNCILIDPMVIKPTDLQEIDADRAAIFQYMISNTDWRIRSGHNTKFMKSLSEVTNKVITVPYDFDFSGFVESGYSFPQEWSDSKSIYERDYLGYCRQNEESYRENLKLFEEKKDEILNLINSFSRLSEKERKECVKFTEGFYKEIKDPDSFISFISRNCQPLDF